MPSKTKEAERAETVEMTFKVAQKLGSCVAYEGGEDKCLVLVAFGDAAQDLFNVVAPLEQIVRKSRR